MIFFLFVKKTQEVDDLFKEHLPFEAYTFDYNYRCYTIDAKYIYGVAKLISYINPKQSKKLLTASSYRAARQQAEDFIKTIPVEIPQEIVKLPVPDGLRYYPFQEEAIHFAKDKQNVMFGDEMGLGKTLEAIGTANLMNAQRILVVCKAIGKSVWESHMNKWLVNKLPICFYPINNGVTILNYEQLSRFMPQLLNIAWDVFIVDEAHYVSNFRRCEGIGKGTQRAKNVFRLAKVAQKNLFLSGTFLRGSTLDLWPFLSELDPENWNDKDAYKKAYCRSEERSDPYYWRLSGGNNLIGLQHKLQQSIFIRREKALVLTELPEKTRTVIALDCDGVTDLMSLQDKLQQGLGSVQSLTKNVQAKQVSPEFARIAQVRKQLAMLKVPQVLAFLEELLLEKNKVVVFAHHIDVVEAIHNHFLTNSVTYYGATTPQQGAKNVKAFQEDPNINLFIGNMDAAGTSITLTVSDTVVFAELPWVPDLMIQAEDRCHRIGQKNAVSIYYLVLAKSLDSRMLDVVLNKEYVSCNTLNKSILDKAYKMIKH
jgi:SWI/SNF-related matrix-associated actin-dependent regulator 1 of chromatin subfamily A